MENQVYKLILLLKRCDGMSVHEFRDYYETKHRLIGEKQAAFMVHYVRRYLDPVPGDEAELPYDVITEVWFDNRRVFDAVLKNVAAETLDAEVIEDEKRLFDRSKSRVMSVVEVESDLAAARAANSPQR